MVPDFNIDVRSNRAVSPVIGVILMVAITVILAAVIGTFVLGLGDSVSQTAPQASLTVKDASTDATSIAEGTSGTNFLIIEHGGGDGINPEDTKIQVSDSSGSGAIWDGSSSTWSVATGLSGDGDADFSMTLSSWSSEFTTTDTLTATVTMTDGGTDGEGVDVSGEYTVTLVDKPSGQIVAERNVDVS